MDSVQSLVGGLAKQRPPLPLVGKIKQRKHTHTKILHRTIENQSGSVLSFELKMGDKCKARSLREQAVKGFNDLGSKLGLDAIAVRSSPDGVAKLYYMICVISSALLGFGWYLL